MLNVDQLTAGYGEVKVLRGVSVSISEGEVVALLGSNGAGKTTFINCLSGLVEETSGDIVFDGSRINELEPFRRVERGLIQVCEGRELFPLMTVEENLKLGAHAERARGSLEETEDRIYQILPDLKKKKEVKATSLSGGQRQMVAIGRGLMGKPKLLMLDEPSLGLAPILAESIFETLNKISKEGTTVLLVEQKVKKTLELSDRGYVLEKGSIALSGNAEGLLSDDKVRETYMGM